MNSIELHRIVSLTFDERPLVRKEAAKLLANVDDPAAIFALIELSYDKDLNVKDLAQQALHKRKTSEAEVMSFAEIFGPKEKQHVDMTLTAEASRDRVLSPITRLFEKKLGKERADVIKSRMMPTIEKIYMKGREGHRSEGDGKQAIQEILTSYLEAMEDVGSPREVEELGPEAAEPEEECESAESKSRLSIAEERIPKPRRETHSEFAQSTALEKEQMTLHDDEHELVPDDILQSTGFKRAYDVLALTGGDDKAMKREIQRMITEYKREVTAAYQLAKKRLKEINISSLAKLKPGMRNINTDLLRIRSVEHIEMGLKKKKTMVTRITLYDENSNSAQFYLEPSRAEALKTGMTIKILKAHAKRFAGTTELGLELSQKGNIYIVI